MKNKIKESIIDVSIKTVAGCILVGALISPCVCAEKLCDMMNASEAEYQTVKVLYLGDNHATDAEGTGYTVKNADKYKYGDIISVTLNARGKVIGINGRCFSLD